MACGYSEQQHSNKPKKKRVFEEAHFQICISKNTVYGLIFNMKESSITISTKAQASRCIIKTQYAQNNIQQLV